MPRPALLALESGDVFPGFSLGAEGEAFGEAVFNTSMAGYQEILTDPSYKGQIISMTYPEIGNYGVNPEDNESSKIHASGFVVRHYAKFPSHHRAKGTLSDFLIEHGIVALEGVDTRKITRILRTQGNQKAVISTKDTKVDSLVKKAKESVSIEHRDLVQEVTTPKAYDWETPDAWASSSAAYPSSGEAATRGDRRERPAPAGVNEKFRIAVYDFGVKWNILRSLAGRGAKVRVFPAGTSSAEILDWKPDGIFLSNGPGDPSAVPHIVNNVKALIGKKPIFGICFGHQILGQAYGAQTYKLKFGHRGGNQPVKRAENGTIEITSQNHGFAVDVKGKNAFIPSHTNANDQTSEGLENKKDKVFSVQYHPEACPGPHDSLYLFDQFFEWMKG